MSKRDFDSRDRPRERMLRHPSYDTLEGFLKAEGRILQAISIRAPLPKVLNGICNALDCQIGNVVSLISLPGNDPSDLAEIAMNAALFGLHTFCSAALVGENEQLLGSLDLYCCDPRSPSQYEFHLIERATSLAVIAVERDMGTCRKDTHRQDTHQDNCGVPADRPGRGHVIEWPLKRTPQDIKPEAGQ